MNSGFRSMRFAVLPLIAMLAGHGVANAGAKAPWLLAQSSETDQYQPYGSQASDPQQQPEAGQQASPPGGAQDETGGVEAQAPEREVHTLAGVDREPSFRPDSVIPSPSNDPRAWEPN